MKKQVLFIHGAGEGAYSEDKKLVENLSQLLGPTYDIRYPQMQNESEAPYDLWVSQIEKELTTMNGPTFLVGHSVGGSVLIKFLSENKITNQVAGIFLLATPFWGGNGGWTYDGYETLMLPKESESKLPKNASLFLYHSVDDETVPFEHLALFAARFPDATVQKLNGKGHQLNNDLSEVAHDIKKL
jgi:uncharacterized protein